MLLKLTLLLSAICAISPETVEIECVISGENCLVEELPEELPANATWKFLCPQNCTSIRMENASFSRFPSELWNTHQQVTYLYLNNTDFDELAFGDFFHAAKLTDFTLNYNKKPMSLRDNCFWGAFKLGSIDFHGSKINELESGAFNGIPGLVELQLTNNKFPHISNDHFRNLPNLRSLYLFNNSIETIESEAFLHNTKLEYLNINGNSLTEVDLLLPFIDPGTIYIAGNRLTKVAYRYISPSFDEVNNGATLYFDNNKLTQLYIQPNFPAEKLILVENPIDRIDTLPMLRSLRYLNLEWCEIKSLDGQRFADKYVNLDRIDLSGNSISSFSKDTFAGLHKLDTLALPFNELKEVDFPRLEKLVTLDLKNNSLTEFPYGEDIRDTFPWLHSLDIRNNDFEEEYLVELVKTIRGTGVEVKWE